MIHSSKLLLCLSLGLAFLALAGCGAGGGGTLQEISPRVDKSALAQFYLEIDKADIANGVHLSWEDVERADYFVIYRSQQSNFDLQSQVIQILSTNGNKAIDRSIDFGRYYYLLKGCNDYGCFESDSGAVAIDVTLEKTNFSQVQASESGINLSWQQVYLANRYQILRGTTPEQEDASLLVTNYATTSLIDSQLQASTKYFYWLRSCTYSNFCSPLSEAASAVSLASPAEPLQANAHSAKDEQGKTKVIPSSPNIPQITSLESSHHDQQDLAWRPVDNASHYEVYRGETEDFASSEKVAEVVDVLNFFSTNLVPATFYFYWVKACTPDVCSAPSMPKQARTALGKQLAIFVEASENLSMRVEWEDSLRGEFYDIYVSTRGNDLAKASKLISHQATSYSYRVNKAHHEYFYWVRACDALGCSAFSKPRSAVSYILQPPQASLQLENQKPKITWQEDKNATRYRLQFSGVDSFEAAEELVIPENASKQKNGFFSYSFEHEFDILKDSFFWLSSCNQLGCSSPTKLVFAKPDVFKLNDNGVIYSAQKLEYNQGSADVSCPSLEDTQQEDCHFGRDAMAAFGNLAKQGSGFAGFDFSKINQQGEILEKQDQAWSDIGNEVAGSNWSCVKDYHTGLRWQSHQGAHQTPIASAHLDMLLQKARDEKLCGLSNWQVPSLLQLASLALVHSSEEIPQIDTNFFPHTQKASYLTSTFVASLDASQAIPLVVDFGHEQASHLVKPASSGASVFVRLVAFEETQVPQAKEHEQWFALRFINQQDGSILDRTTSLSWKNCLEVATESMIRNSCSQEEAIHDFADKDINWQQALKFQSKPWRLPNLKELLSLMKSNASLEDSFPITLKGKFITSTPHVPVSRDAFSNNQPSKIFLVDFDRHTAYAINQNTSGFSVLMVKDK